MSSTTYTIYYNNSLHIPFLSLHIELSMVPMFIYCYRAALKFRGTSWESVAHLVVHGRVLIPTYLLTVMTTSKSMMILRNPTNTLVGKSFAQFNG